MNIKIKNDARCARWYLTELGSGSVLWPAGLGGTLFLKHKNIFNNEH
jgi:hypothetical protein